MNRRRHQGAVPALVAALVLGTAGAAQAAAPGTLDSSFGSGGVATLGADSQLFGVAVQSDGSVVAAGQSGGTTLVERFTPGGQPAGQAGGPSGAGRAVAIQSDGKIVVAGGGPGMFVERLSASGTLDTSFGSNGVAVASGLGSGAIGNAVAVQPDGKIVVAGTVPASDPANGTEFALARFNSNGTLDTSFGSGGTDVVNLGLPYAVARGVAVQPDGKIVFVGDEQGSTTYAFFNAIVARLTSSGGLDSSFAGSGVVSYHATGGGYDSFNAVTIQNNGDVVAAGVDVASNPFAVFMRLTPSGSPDGSFGASGVSMLSSGTFTSTPVGANGVGIAGGGRIVGAGAVQMNGTDFRAGLWAVSSSGVADSSFGSGGIVEQQTGAEACALAVAPDGSLVIVGDTVNPARPQSTAPCLVNSTSTAFVARYIGDGPPPPPVTSSGAAPTVTTGGASAVGETSATVAGTVNPNDLSTSYVFQYGTSTSYGSSSPSADAGSGDTPTSVSATATGLMPGTTYHYRLQATNADGTANGTDGTFVTSTGAPSLTAGGASGVGEVAATITGRINPGGLATTYHFEYGTTTKYGSKTAVANVSGGSTLRVTAALKGLRPGTKYHYRLVAANTDGPAIGGDRTFTTLPRLHAKLSGLPSSGRISGLSTSGLKIMVGCSADCSISASIVISAKTASKHGLGTKAITIARASGKLKGKGTSHLQLKLNKTGKQYASKLGGLAVTLSISAKPAGGGPTVKVSKSLTA